MGKSENAHSVTGQAIAQCVVERANFTLERVRNVVALGSVLLVAVRVKWKNSSTPKRQEEAQTTSTQPAHVAFFVRVDSL